MEVVKAAEMAGESPEELVVSARNNPYRHS